MAKDNFRIVSKGYALYRPKYNAKLAQFITSLLANSKQATVWDCATGNGQLATLLAPYFHQIFATDLSALQIESATRLPNICYSVQQAEQTSFEDNTFELITIATALHWFNFNAFYKEVNRVLKPQGKIMALCYGHCAVLPSIDAITYKLYKEITGPYWDKERKYVDDAYGTIPFPFKPISTPQITLTEYWTLDHYIGYLNTWSGLQHFIKANNFNPIDNLLLDYKNAWGKENLRVVNFPLHIICGSK